MRGGMYAVHGFGAGGGQVAGSMLAGQVVAGLAAYRPQSSRNSRLGEHVPTPPLVALQWHCSPGVSWSGRTCHHTEFGLPMQVGCHRRLLPRLAMRKSTVDPPTRCTRAFIAHKVAPCVARPIYCYSLPSGEWPLFAGPPRGEPHLLCSCTWWAAGALRRMQ